MQVRFKRLQTEPLIDRDIKRFWESRGVFAPAIVCEDGRYRMLYRAQGSDNISRMGYAESQDGLVWVKDLEPRVGPLPHDGTERHGVEDARIVKIDDLYYVTYTAASGRLRRGGMDWSARVRVLVSKDLIHFRRARPSLPAGFDKDGVLFPRRIDGDLWMLHRLIPDIWLSHGPSLRKLDHHGPIMGPTSNSWESLRIGAGAPPIETELGWLLFYHGVSEKIHYSMGAAVLDYADPSRVLYRLPYPVLEPTEPYERYGVIPNVVFGTSVLDVGEDWWMYYGAADTAIAAASISKTALLTELKRYPIAAMSRPNVR
jgi:beta-1,2-mannobiose phosphorylase / 1,2-beta-oligomannan phosphorylase